ncbi:MAG: S49 family peptidase [Bacteroidales bacterium]|nr:S49 family peptidase [Bacteroidales bacterium]
MNFSSARLKHQLLTLPWSITEAEANAWLPMIHSLFVNDAGFEAGEEPSESIPFSYAMVDGKPKQNSFQEVEPNSIAIVPLIGAMLKYDAECGPVGTDTIAARIQEADSHPNIMATIIRMNSGGGSVEAIPFIYDVIENAKKPVIAWIDMMAGSACYYLASKCDLIIASAKANIIGSIGTVSSWEDWQGYWEKEGVKFHTVYAPQSTLKNRFFDKANNGDYEEMKEKWLRPFAQDFIDSVLENRKEQLTVDEKHDCFKGEIYLTEEALKIGLIDEIGNLTYAVDRAVQLAEARKTSENNNDIHNSLDRPKPTDKSTKNTNMKLPFLNSLLGVESLAFADGHTSLTEDMITTIENALAQADADSKTHATSLKTAQDAEQTAKDTLTNGLSELDAIGPEVAKAEGMTDKVTAVKAILTRKPGTPAAKINNDKDDDTPQDGVDWETINSLPHNKEADAACM